VKSSKKSELSRFLEVFQTKAESCVSTAARACRCVRAMDEDTLEVIQALCTRVGMIMEDASAEALMMRAVGVTATSEKLAQLARAVEAIATLLFAAQAFCRLHQDGSTRP
jgi:threonine synthase